ncbi:hypothetical protein N0V85_005340 [Neurospora sp. IMI 360204]|nr:hypothetical protein N0V85_005340 [Neurospora sp. IMI 360204]
MRSSSIPSVLLALLLAAPLVSAHSRAGSVVGSLFARADDGYENTVCRPPVKEGSNGPIPPCSSLENIEYQCAPNGTSPLALEAHKQCMCGGSFFAEWPFCQQCLYVHGLRSERDVKRYIEVLSSASSILCGAPTPTEVFAKIFTSVDYEVPEPTDGATVSRDQAVSKTDISYYMTTTISQGPGKITGSALSATATDAPLAPQTTNTGGDDGGDDDAKTTSTTSGPFTITTSSSANGSSGTAAAETSSKPNSATGVKAGIAGVVGVAAAMVVAMML